MRSAGRLACAVLLLLAVASFASAQNPLRPPRKPLPGSPSPAAPAQPETTGTGGGPPALRVGVLLPLTGPAAWFGEEMRHGMELAAAELNPRPAKPQPAPRRPPAGADAKAAPREPALASPELPTLDVPPPAVQVILDVMDVQPLDVKEAATDFTRVAAAGATVVFTASPTPTLAIHPLAASRDVLVIHQGLPSNRFPPGSRTLLQLRPSSTARGEALAAYAWERGVRRLALLAAGDDFGKALRAAVSARWRGRGVSLAHEESLTLEAPDLRARLTRLGRLGPEAIALAFRGADLGDIARRVRDAGYTGLLLAADDDPTALLTAGPALSGAELLSDAFAPEPDSRGARFAKAYEAKFKRPPSRFAANAYQAVLILAEGVRRLREEGGAGLGGSRLRVALLARPFPSVYGGEVVIRDDGTLERPFALLRVSAGRAEFVRYVTATGRPAVEQSRAPAAAPPWAAVQ